MTTPVPCDGCRACCIREAVVLFPDRGDDPAAYRTVAFPNPLTGEAGLRLAHKPNGECVYLDDRGCTIHARAPSMCRAFDCRLLYRRMSPDERAAGLRGEGISADVIKAAEARLASLDAPIPPSPPVRR